MVETNVRSKQYKLVMGKLYKNSPMMGINTPGIIENIVEGVLSILQHMDAIAWLARENPVLIMELEFRQLIKSLKPNKLLDLEWVLKEMLKEITSVKPRIILNMFKKCISQSRFPGP